jgi:hypothetical protein
MMVCMDGLMHASTYVSILSIPIDLTCHASYSRADLYNRILNIHRVYRSNTTDALTNILDYILINFGCSMN